MRRAWLRGRENLHKRYLIHVTGINLSIVMRALFGCGAPRGTANAVRPFGRHSGRDLATFRVYCPRVTENAALLVVSSDDQ